MSKASRAWLLSASLCSISLAVAPAGCAQASSAIHVESNQVLVRVFVRDKEKYDEASEAESNPREAAKKWQDVMVLNLTASDFRLFEDGREQIVRSAVVERAGISEVRDSAGRHYERAGVGGGRWIYPDIPQARTFRGAVPLRGYVLAYDPPSSPEGSCHKIEIKVKARNHPVLQVFYTDRYCKVDISPVDPLAGTKFGQEMEADMGSAGAGKIALSFTAQALFGGQGESRVILAMAFLPKALRYDLNASGGLNETIGMSAGLDARRGTPAARVTDFACCDTSDTWGALNWSGSLMVNAGADVLLVPSSYVREISQPPGDYLLRAVLSDGINFGRAELPVSVPRLDGEHLALSDIVLARRFRPASPAPQDPTATTPSTYVPLVSKGVEYTPTADTAFKKSDAFLFFLQLYDPFISTDPACKQSAPAAQPAQPISSSAETSAASSTTSNVGGSGSAIAPTAAPSNVAAAIPPQCLPQAQINLRIVDAKSGAVVRNLDPLNAAEFAIPGNPIVPIGSGIHIDDLPPGQYELEAQAAQLPSTSPASLNAPPPAPLQTTPWHSASFSIQ
jgi:hypothetical protein